MKKIMAVLTLDSIRDLLKYKSFFLLMFLIILADRSLQHLGGKTSLHVSKEKLAGIGDAAAVYLYSELPGRLAELLFNWRSLLVIVGLFLLKQLISLWPSSDMRRMHRQERLGFGLLKSLIILKRGQIIWDAGAVAAALSIFILWLSLAYSISRLPWLYLPSLIWPGLFLLAAGLAAPFFFAALSYSSKLAVISHGGYAEKFDLFARLLLDKRVAISSWIFFTVRLLLEALFVAALPAVVLLTIPNFWLRLALAGLIATSAYSFLKMATFKFFLHIYRTFPLVQKEYEQYYEERKKI